jgi:phosphohistidine phosphatase
VGFAAFTVDIAATARDSAAVQIFLIRHAEAIDETLELRDPHRHLTEKGRQQARALGDRLRWHDCTPTLVWASPLVRAIQTAELVLATLGVTTLVGAEPALAPGEDVRPLQQRLGQLGADAVVMLVGHEPVLSGLGALCAGAEDFAVLAKAEAVRLDGGAVGAAGTAGTVPSYRVRWRFGWSDAAPRT